MPTRKLIVLAGLALAIAALAPASALAKAGGTDRPVKGKVSGLSVFCPATGETVANHSGVATHVGKLTFHAEGSFISTSPTTGFGEGTASLVAANGDELTGTWTDEAVIKFDEGVPIGHIGMIVLTITGGSGRFADASGTINSVQDGLGLFRDEEGCAHDFNEETWTGHISY